jgi:hypothetical protein
MAFLAVVGIQTGAEYTAQSRDYMPGIDYCIRKRSAPHTGAPGGLRHVARSQLAWDHSTEENMDMSQNLDPHHRETRAILRIVGPGIALVGLVFVIVGIASFFASFNSHSMPRRFWCVFVGMPLLGVGVGISKFAFLGTVGRYVAGEVAPVAKDTMNYMADGTKGAVRTMATAMGEGLRAGMGDKDTTMAERQTCSSCGEANDDTAKFCKSCGKPLAKTCAACGQANDADAKFCDNCGGRLA